MDWEGVGGLPACLVGWLAGVCSITERGGVYAGEEAQGKVKRNEGRKERTKKAAHDDNRNQSQCNFQRGRSAPVVIPGPGERG